MLSELLCVLSRRMPFAHKYEGRRNRMSQIAGFQPMLRKSEAFFTYEPRTEVGPQNPVEPVISSVKKDYFCFLRLFPCGSLARIQGDISGSGESRKVARGDPW